MKSSMYKSSSNQHQSSMYKSARNQFSLPKISNSKEKVMSTSRYNNNTNSNRSSFSKTKNKSLNQLPQKTCYVKRVQQQLIDQKQYPYTQTQSINQEQNKLKQILRQFNNQTLKILQKYIDQPVKKPYLARRNVPIQSVYQIRTKELDNATNHVQICKKQIEALQARCQNLKYISKEQFQHRIQEIRQQKIETIHQNKQLARQITLNGLQIVKGKESYVKELQYQKYLIETKKDKLSKDFQHLQNQISQQETKIKEIEGNIQKYQQQQSYTLKQFEQQQRFQANNRLLQQQRSKNKLFEHNKTMFASMNYQLKHKYLQKLKELDEVSTANETNQKKIQDHSRIIQENQVTIKKLQENLQKIIQKNKSVSKTETQLKMKISVQLSEPINLEKSIKLKKKQRVDF